MPKTFKDLKFIPHPNRPMFNKQAALELDNHYGISVVNGDNAYCNSDTYEVAILFCGNITYDTEFTDDVLGYQTPEDIDKLLINLDKIKKHHEKSY